MSDASLLLSPASPLFLGGLLVAFARGAAQDVIFVAAPLLALVCVWILPEAAAVPVNWLGLDLRPLAPDAVARLFGTAFAIAALAGSVFALSQRSSAERAAVLVYAGAAEGVVFAGDLLTLFVFWEIMAIASAMVIFSNGALKAGLRYALMHALGGVLLFAGIAATYAGGGGLAIRPFSADSPGTVLMLAGILVNAGAPPVSAWVADAYPRASWSGAVFLSAFTTKAAVAVLIRLFPGEAALVPIGLVMAFYGLVYALLENDIRRLLSYSIVGQVGFMVVAIGIGTPLALAAAGAHALVHILYKSLLMMAAGSVLRATGTTRLTELGGLARRLPVATGAMVIGGLALAAMPFTAGFVSKSAIMQSLAEDRAMLAWFALTAVSAGSFVYAGLRLPWFAMLKPGATPVVGTTSLSMNVAMTGLAAVIVAIGVDPSLLAEIAPPIAAVPVLTADHILFQLQLLGGAAVCCVLLLKLLAPANCITRDADASWRKIPEWSLRAAGAAILLKRGFADRLTRDVMGYKPMITKAWHRRRALAGHWRTGDIALAATALLGVLVLIAAL